MCHGRDANRTRRNVEWTGADWLLAAGVAVGLGATAEAAWSLRDRFALEYAGLSSLERAAVALWDLRPIAPAVAAVGALLVLAGLREPPGRLDRARDWVRQALAALAGGYAALAVVVLTAAAWIAAAGRAGADGELALVYTGGQRAFTLVTQAIAYLPLGALFALIAYRAVFREPAAADVGRDETAGAPAKRPSEEMEALWQERLAFGPRRERARVLLARVRALEEAGDYEQAERLAEEFRRL